jgi:DNA-binding transcriptional MerR regulator
MSLGNDIIYLCELNKTFHSGEEEEQEIEKEGYRFYSADQIQHKTKVDIALVLHVSLHLCIYLCIAHRRTPTDTHTHARTHARTHTLIQAR